MPHGLFFFFFSIVSPHYVMSYIFFQSLNLFFGSSSPSSPSHHTITLLPTISLPFSPFYSPHSTHYYFISSNFSSFFFTILLPIFFSISPYNYSSSKPYPTIFGSFSPHYFTLYCYNSFNLSSPFLTFLLPLFFFL
jgi:hypothetical protein